jgi:hypothetical protein
MRDADGGEGHLRGMIVVLQESLELLLGDVVAVNAAPEGGVIQECSFMETWW